MKSSDLISKFVYYANKAIKLPKMHIKMPQLLYCKVAKLLLLFIQKCTDTWAFCPANLDNFLYTSIPYSMLMASRILIRDAINY